MRHLNYSHLLYFWTVAKEGSIAKAANVLHLTPQTISGQLKLLDDAVGERLFQRAGRRLVLSDTGQLVFQYADEIFALGAELAHVVRGRAPDAPLTLNVGIVDSIPKLVAYRVMEPALRLESGLRISCNEGKLETLLSDLAIHRLDLVLADGPVPSGLNVRAYSHLLGTSGTTFFAAGELAKRYRARFPQSLKDAPFLLPARDLPLRRLIEEWFEEIESRPRIVGEFADSALMMSFGQAGAGILPGPSAIEKEIAAMFRLSIVGRAETIVERFYAISPERKLKHPAVVAISEQAREQIFGERAPA